MFVVTVSCGRLLQVKILDALCHWKLDTCAEIHKHIATLQKENDNESIRRLFANAKRIRLSINFDPDHNSSAPPLLLPVKTSKTVAFSDDIEEHEKAKEEMRLDSVKLDKHEGDNLSKPKVESEFVTVQALKAEDEHGPAKTVKVEKLEMPSSSPAQEKLLVANVTVDVKKEDSTTVAPPPAAISKRMDISILCAGVPQSKEEVTKSGVHSSVQSNRFLQKQNGESLMTAHRAVQDVSPQPIVKKDTEALSDNGVKGCTPSSEQDLSSKSPRKGSVTQINEDNSGEHTHSSVVAIVGSKKRTIIDDDSSDSSSDTDITKATTDKNVNHQAATSPRPRKKRKASIENSNSAAGQGGEEKINASPKADQPKANGTAASPVLKVEASATDTPEPTSVPSKVAMDEKDVRPTASDAAMAAANKKADSSSPTKAKVGLTSNGTEEGSDRVEEIGKATSAVTPSGPTSTSPSDPAAAPEAFDITCESCKKCYDMRYLDPPLVERPSDEWRCFECLVNDARGWPRRRKTTPREPFSPRAGEESSSKKRSSSSKSRSGSSSSKKLKKSSSKSRSSSSSKKKNSHSSSSKRKSSSSKSSSSKKSSSSSSSKKHKKRKSSSSAHHHSSSHSHHHRRRHHSHYHHEEFAKLVRLFRERKEQRLGIEEARIKGDLQMAFDESPQGWRVASSTLDELRTLIQTLSGGSLEQDRLRGRLILILKDQEKLEEQRIKQQELAWNILPRRQSSRIAIGRMKNQSAQESDAEDGYSDDVENRRPGLRSRRSHSSTSDGVDDRQKHDRAWRARRRHQVSDDDMDLDDEEDEVDGTGVATAAAGNWIDWSLDLFSRPVDPELDGCPNYLSVINHPMDLGTIRSRVESSFYRDVELVWQNCRKFNAPDTMVVQFADLLSRLSRSMCIAAEKNGVDRMKDKGIGGDDESDHDSEDSISDASKAESRSSVNKAWTESSASESSESGDGDSSSDGDSDSDSHSRKRRPTRTSTKKPQTRSRSTRSSRASGSPSTRSSRSTPSRSSKKRPAPTSSSEEESSASEDDEVFSPVRNNRRRRSASMVDGKVDPPTEDEDSSADDSGSNHPPPQTGVPSPSPPPPPPPQTAQKRSKPRLIISDSSSSDDSSDSDDNSSSSSSSDSDGSDSDARPASKQPQPPPPSSADVPAPPPPSPPPPATSPDDNKPQVRSSPSYKTKSKNATEKKSTKASTGKPSSSYTPLLNSYLSPSSSSSSDFSSDDSESSGDSDSD
ncbi:unnamed protein product [Phytophthora lilii]|uniref:Unnamed protein product n=1 Tax=Phytophthora lilii TaxID=2077276 RepID=A0A9W6TIT9_9STRA|nr:unnamed protein product [Phytophthora lilii]